MGRIRISCNRSFSTSMVHVVGKKRNIVTVALNLTGYVSAHFTGLTWAQIWNWCCAMSSRIAALEIGNDGDDRAWWRGPSIA